MLTVYLTVCGLMSLIAYIFFAVDKARAKKDGARLPELTLLTLSALGGGLGGLLGMQILRHKTDFRRKPHFCIGVPLCFGIQLAFAIVLAFFAGLAG